MKVVVAIDSFKGSLSSMEAGNAAKEGIRRVFENADVKVFPVADGGEGTVDALVEGLGGEIKTASVCDPLARRITAEYGIVGEAAILEVAAASGITLLKKDELNPMLTTTFGVGEIIKAAIERGCRNFIVGIGGSATNDGGVGMLQALGFELLDKKGNQVTFGAERLDDICIISDKNAMPELKECSFSVACDVENPLCGETGCSRIFAPQKGADEEMIIKMDKSLSRYAELVKEYNPSSNMNYPGAGAAGGLGFAFLSFLNSKLEKGIDLVLQATKIENEMKSADLVITGEGRLDAQSIMGKAPSGIAEIAKKYNKPVLAFAGSVTKEAVVCNSNGIDAFFPVVRNITTLDEAMEKGNAYRNLADTVEQTARLIKVFKRKED